MAKKTTNVADIENMDISELSSFLEKSGAVIEAKEAELADLRNSVKAYGIALSRKVAKLTGVVDSVSTARSSGGKRGRATPAEVEERKSGILAALKGTKKGKGKGIREISEATGLEVKFIRPLLSKLYDEKLIDSEGSKATMTYFLLD